MSLLLVVGLAGPPPDPPPDDGEGGSSDVGHGASIGGPSRSLYRRKPQDIPEWEREPQAVKPQTETRTAVAEQQERTLSRAAPSVPAQLDIPQPDPTDWAAIEATATAVQRVLIAEMEADEAAAILLLLAA
jgi:hypothetical protein